MRQIEKVTQLHEYLDWCKANDKTVGLVPTMGALHEGHLSLVDFANDENDIVIVSIFVNPTQFNKEEDLKKYPRTLEKDAELLKPSGCDVIFAPSVEDMYPENFTARSVELGFLDQTLEGENRPGHFNGVIEVVQRLFDLTQPTRAYFGRKDFQQVAVVKAMVKALDYSTEIRVGETIREKSGLAMSSRNLLLNAEQKSDAAIISEVLSQMKEWADTLSPQLCQKKGKELINSSSLELEYLEVIHPLTFEPIDDWIPGATACAVAYCGGVRLIDNMELIEEA